MKTITLEEAFKNATPFKRHNPDKDFGVRVAMSGELTNELGSPIANFDIDENPSKINKANAHLTAHCLNNFREVVEALEMMVAHYDDLCKSNPGFMGKMCLQDYELWNKALLAAERALPKAKQVQLPD